MERDFTPSVIAKIKAFLNDFPAALDEFDRLVTRNRIFVDRTVGAGPISAERALAYSMTGPNLRAAGVDYDVRVMNPYSSYQDFDFNIPVGVKGDTYDRYMVRMGEMVESMKIIRQAIDNLPEGNFHADVPEF